MAILSKYLAYICLPNRAAKRRPEEKEPERVKPQVSEEKDEDEKVSSCFLILLCFLHPKVIFFFEGNFLLWKHSHTPQSRQSRVATPCILLHLQQLSARGPVFVSPSPFSQPPSPLDDAEQIPDVLLKYLQKNYL